MELGPLEAAFQKTSGQPGRQPRDGLLVWARMFLPGGCPAASRPSGVCRELDAMSMERTLGLKTGGESGGQTDRPQEEADHLGCPN